MVTGLYAEAVRSESVSEAIAHLTDALDQAHVSGDEALVGKIRSSLDRTTQQRDSTTAEANSLYAEGQASLAAGKFILATKSFKQALTVTGGDAALTAKIDKAIHDTAVAKSAAKAAKGRPERRSVVDEAGAREAADAGLAHTQAALDAKQSQRARRNFRRGSLAVLTGVRMSGASRSSRLDSIDESPDGGSGQGGGVGPKPPRSAPLERSQPLAELSSDALYDLIDVDGNGELSFEEYAEWWYLRQKLTGISDDYSLETAKSLFEELDADESGCLDRSEFALVIEELAVSDWVMQLDEVTNQWQYVHQVTGEVRSAQPEVSA